METTLVETLQTLRNEGYTEDFNLQTDCLTCKDGEFSLHPEDFHIDKFFRFEGDENDPGDSAILYAISSKKHKLKGVLVNAYGMYAEPLTNEMVDKLR